MATRSRTFVTIAAAISVLVAAVALGGGIALVGGIVGSGKTVVTVRLWDDKVAAAYEASFAEFEQSNSDIAIDVTVIPWSQYWTQLESDVLAGSAADIFWINSSYYADYADKGALLDIDRSFGTNAKSGWAPSVVDQFTRNGSLWGIPQLSDAGIAIYYNKAALAASGVSAESLEALVWNPDPAADTFLPVVQALTKDTSGRPANDPEFDASALAQFGYNAANELQAIQLPFIGSNGGRFQDGEEFTFTSPRTAEAMQYLVDLVNRYRVSPPAAATNADGDYSLDQFVGGRMALFQSGLYNLASVAEAANFDWGVASIPAGPAGRVSVTNGVAAAGNTASSHPGATRKVLAWLGSERGNRFIGANGAAVPGGVDAQQAYFDYWTSKGVDVSKFFDVVAGDATTISPPQGTNFNAVVAVYDPIFDEVFANGIPVAEGLERAEAEANAVIAK
ncbi:ABC transporter substrate-binding protein [Luethyella okanaganae]|uniref:ABC transporter substrate-binding protein n=1 Tax=Luethyella okanaganae TaxID=69372 RepID=A0ABW1VGZ4_9MICO